MEKTRIIGIVGSEGAKFTLETEIKAKDIIRGLLVFPDVLGVSSGACHLGGIDVWAEEAGDKLGLQKFIFPPKTHNWLDGYKPRNLQIVNASTEVHCITLKVLPDSYQGMRFGMCYHCGTSDHVKSGGCWTAKRAEKKGKPAYWHII